jgi:hypothetical protein
MPKNAKSKARASVPLSAKVWMDKRGNGQINIKIEGQPLAHVSKKNQTNLYDRLLAHLERTGAALPVKGV